jgi:hypothetical protein
MVGGSRDRTETLSEPYKRSGEGVKIGTYVGDGDGGGKKQ